MEYYITLLPQINLMRTATADMTSWYDVCTSSAQSHDTGEAALCWGGDQELTISTNLHWPDKYAHLTPEYGTYSSAVLSIRNGTLLTHVIVSIEVCQWSSSHDYPLHWPVVTPGPVSHMSPVMLYAGVQSSGPGTSAVKRSIGFTIGFHIDGEGVYLPWGNACLA